MYTIQITLSAIVKSLAGLENRATNYVNVYRIPELYGALLKPLQTTDFTNINFTRTVSRCMCIYVAMYVHVYTYVKPKYNYFKLPYLCLHAISATICDVVILYVPF